MEQQIFSSALNKGILITQLRNVDISEKGKRNEGTKRRRKKEEDGDKVVCTGNGINKLFQPILNTCLYCAS